MSDQKIKNTDWGSMDHNVPKGYDKFVVMLAEAGSAKNELILLTRYQKIIRAVWIKAYDEGLQVGLDIPASES